MDDEAAILRKAAELIESRRPFVMATVVSAKGSTPRNPGARMLWCPGETGGEGDLAGTVGGGQFEHMVIDAARTHLKNRTGGVERYVLGADADQCCGGVMEVFFECHGARQRVVLFGAGHVAREIAELLRAAPVEVVVADDRPEWNTAERFPGSTRTTSFAEGVAAARAHPAATLACVMTCSHGTDFDLLRELLAPGERPAFLGLIGSRSKRSCLFGRLVASGIDEARVQSVRCPIGVGDTGKEPKLVAISIAAQLLVETKSLASL